MLDRTNRASRRVAALGLSLLLVLLAALAVGGCGGGDDEGSGSATTATQGADAPLSSEEVAEVAIGLTAPELSLNLLTGPTIPNISLMANVVQGLVALDSSGELVPGLAEEWEQTSPTEYVYRLKSGQRFSNGDPVTADDVVYSMNYEMNPRTGSVTSGFYLSVRSIEKSGPGEITVTLRNPDPTWPYVPGQYSGWIYEKDSLKAAGENLGSPQGIPIGSGPYKIAEFASDRVVFERNEYYSGSRPPVARFVVRLIGDDGTRMAAMQAGDIDGALYVPLQATRRWASLPDVELFSVTTPNLDLLWFNTEKEPFDDVHVRRALMYAFNRDAVVEKVLQGNATVANPQVLPDMWVNEMSVDEAESRTDEQGPQYPFDMDRAREELEQSAHADGFSTTVYYTASAPELGLALQGLSQSVKELGIDLTVRELTDVAYYERAGSGDFTMLSSTGSFDYPDPLGYYNIINCGCAKAPAGFNFSRYDNPQVDRLFRAAFADTDQASRVDTIVEAVARISADVPSPTLWFRNSVTALSDDLTLTDLGPWTTWVTPWMAKIGARAAG